MHVQGNKIKKCKTLKQQDSDQDNKDLEDEPPEEENPEVLPLKALKRERV